MISRNKNYTALSSRTCAKKGLLVTAMRSSYTVHYLMNCRAQKRILHVTGKLRLCIFSNTQLFILALKPDIFSLLEFCAFPSRERYPQKPSWLSCTFPLGMVPASPSCGRWSSPLASPPAPFLHPHQSCGEKKSSNHIKSQPVLFFSL